MSAQDTLGYVFRFLDIFPDASFIFLNTVNITKWKIPWCFGRGPSQPHFPLFPFARWVLHQNYLRAAFHTQSLLPAPSAGNVSCHVHVSTYKSNVLMPTPPQNLILYQAGHAFSSLYFLEQFTVVPSSL